MVAYLTLNSSVIVVSLIEQEEKRRVGFEPAMLFEDRMRELVAWGRCRMQRIGLISRFRSLRRRGLWSDRSPGGETR